MKLSFSFSQNQSSFITEDDHPKTITEVIAPLANEWTPHKTSTNVVMDSNMSNGLNFRSKKGSKRNVERFKSDSWIERLMLKRLKRDLDRLPEHGGMDEVENMPVENFAKALLKGYGWYEGRGVGKNAKEDIKVFEIEKRNGREGLGFVNDIMVPPSNDSKKQAANLKNKTVSNRERKESTSFKRGRERERYNSESWLSSHIRVRIITKELEGGRLYLRKGEVVEVVGPTTCDVVMDDGRELIEGVDEEFLETALPRRGGQVLVLCGRYKGVYGSLQEKDMDKETAVVRDADTQALVNVRFEQIAEYVRDPDDIGS